MFPDILILLSSGRAPQNHAHARNSCAVDIAPDPQYRVCSLTVILTVISHISDHVGQVSKRSVRLHGLTRRASVSLWRECIFNILLRLSTASAVRQCIFNLLRSCACSPPPCILELVHLDGVLLILLGLPSVRFDSWEALNSRSAS